MPGEFPSTCKIDIQNKNITLRWKKGQIHRNDLWHHWHKTNAILFKALILPFGFLFITIYFLNVKAVKQCNLVHLYVSTEFVSLAHRMHYFKMFSRLQKMQCTLSNFDLYGTM